VIYMMPGSGKRSLKGDPRIWGQILTPSSYANAPAEGRVWCADNEAFTEKYDFKRFYEWLWMFRAYRTSCVFVSAKDVVGQCWPTLRLYLFHWLLIKLMGYPVALVAQDGLEAVPLALRFLPYDALFIGGSTEWKMSPAADICIAAAQARGKWTHVGRVNSQKRMRHFKRVGVDSVDGTSLTYAPDRDFERFNKVLIQPSLFGRKI